MIVAPALERPRRPLAPAWISATLAVLASLPTPARASGEQATPKRPLPEYAGRKPRAAPASALLWVPRVVFFPLYLTSEFLIRRPLGALISAAERAKVPAFLYDVFAFGPDHKSGFAPTAFVDFGFKPSVGIYVFWDDAFFAGNDLRLHASTWGFDWLAGSVVERIHVRGGDTLSLAVSGVHRPDFVYFGPGPTALQSNQGRYSADRIDASATLAVPWRWSRVETTFGVRSATFRDGDYPGVPPILQQVAAGVFPLPDGFARGYTAEYNRVLVVLDSRRPYPAPGSGARLEARVEQSNDVRRSPASGWLRYEAGAAGYIDVNSHRRVVSLSAVASFADPLGTEPVPFTEIAALGGDAPMSGFYPGRLFGRSATAGGLRYRWPVGPFLNGSMQAAVGNVFGPRLEDFDPKLLRFSAALSVETDTSPDASFSFLVGFGTETFDHGAQVDSFRLAFGTSRGL